MSENNFSQRNYRMSYADLAIFANSIVFAMNRDLDEFESYGVSSGTISNLEEVINEFQDLPDDEINRNDISNAVEVRDSLRNTILNIMRGISARAKAIYGESSAKYRSLSPGLISKLSDNNLLVAARQVYTVAENNLSALEAEGLTESYLEYFNSTINNYEDAINDVNNKKTIRDDATEIKIIKGNELYSLISKYCDYGKIIWGGVSDSKYNDYVIYSTGTGGSGGNVIPPLPVNLDTPTGLGYNYANRVVYWNGVIGATTYKVEKSSNNINYTTIYNGEEDHCTTSALIDFPTYIRVKALSPTGTSEYSEVLIIPEETNLPAPQNFAYNEGLQRLSWDPVAGMNRYEVVLRAAGVSTNWTVIYSGTSTYIAYQFEAGSWETKVRANTDTSHGEWSEVLSINI